MIKWFICFKSTLPGNKQKYSIIYQDVNGQGHHYYYNFLLQDSPFPTCAFAQAKSAFY
jgi:hypothetical protein